MKFNITSIELYNYRQYRGKNTIDIEEDNKKNVSIIIGQNGAGKSNILNALTWAFYGVESHIDSTKDSSKMPIINTNELNDNLNLNVNASVKVHLITDKGPWLIQREITGSKTLSGKTKIENSKLTIVYKKNNQDVVATGDDLQVMINNLLPKALRSFFFMDGEKLREFFNESSSENIAKSIEKVSQLDLVFKSAENFEKQYNRYRRSVKDTNPQIDNIQKNIDLKENEIKKDRENLKEDKEYIDKYNKELSEIRTFLQNSGIEVIKELANEREDIEKDIRWINNQIETKSITKNQYLVKIAPTIFLKKYILNSIDAINKRIEKGELPANIKENFVKELIDKKSCICGNHISKGEEDALREYMKSLSLSELNEIAISGKTHLQNIIKEISNFKEIIEKHNEDISNLEDELDRKTRRLSQIKLQISNSENTEKIVEKEKRRDKLIGKIDQLNQIDRLLETGLNGKIKELNEEKENLNKALSMSEKNNELKEKLKLIQKSLETLAEIEKIIKEKIRKQIEIKTNDNFFKLIRKKDAFKKVEINEIYEVKVIHKSGYNVIDNLSAGEYMILGIAFMSSMMEISGFKAPVIIDTPLGKIDDIHRDNITKELPTFLEGTQLMLLVTPTEYDKKVQENLSKFVHKGNNYRIIENESNTEAEVKEI